MTVYRASASSYLAGPFWFLLWIGLSFLAHYHAGKAVTLVTAKIRHSANEDNSSLIWLSSFLLALFQIGIGGILLIPLQAIAQFVRSQFTSAMIILPTKVDPVANCPAALMTPQLQLTLALSHLITAVATNASIAFATPPLAFAVKATEPLTTSVLQAVIKGKRLKSRVIIALPLATIGAIGLMWRSEFTSKVFTGIAMAFVSNLACGLRNMAFKTVLDAPADGPAIELMTGLSPFRVLVQMSLSSMVLLIWAVLGLTTWSPIEAGRYLGNRDALLASLLSSLFHVSYTWISVIVLLPKLSLTAHSSANLAKRVVISILFFGLNLYIPNISNMLFGLLFIFSIVAFCSRWKYSGLGDSNEFQMLLLAAICLVSVFAIAFVPIRLPLRQPINSNLQINENPAPLVGLKVQPLNDFDNSHHKLSFLTVDSSNENILFPTYFKKLDADEEDFLKVDLFSQPDRADWLASRLTADEDIVREALRIHYHLLSRLLSGYKQAIVVNNLPEYDSQQSAVAIRKLLTKVFGLTMLRSCSFRPVAEVDNTRCLFESLNVTSDIVVIVNNGFNLNYASSYDMLRVISGKFTDNRIIVVTRIFEFFENQHEQVAKLEELLKQRTNIALLLESRQSFNAASKHFSPEICFLSPDISLSLNFQQFPIDSKVDIAWMNRRNNNEELRPEHNAVLQSSFVDSLSYDTWQEMRTLSVFLYLSRANVIVSNNHEMQVLAILLRKRRVYFIGTVTAFSKEYKATWDRSCITATDIDDATAAANKLLT